MLQILLGTEQQALQQAVLRRICDDAAAGVTGQLLIVPEQYSHEAERLLCEAGGDAICRSAEVLSFSRLADRVSALYGGVSRPALDGGGRLLAMALAAETVSSRLKLYGTSLRKPEFLLRLLAVLDELKAGRVDAPQLTKAAAEVGGQLAVKLEELALLRESLETVSAGMGQDANDRLAVLAEQLEAHPFAAGRQIYLLGFTDWTALERSVLAALLTDAAGVTAALLGDGGSTGPFAVSADSVRQLRHLAAGLDVPCRVERLARAETRPPELRHLGSCLFGGGAPWTGKPEALTLHQSADAAGACLDAAGRIQVLAEAGWRYRDVAVCCADWETYRPVLEAVCQRFSIPLYASGSDPLEQDPVTGMLLAALDAATGGMETEDVLRFLKSGLSAVPPEDCDRLENYARTWRIRGRRWERSWDLHPDGVGLPLDDAAQAALERLNGLRAAAVAPLAALRDGLRAAENTAGQVTALYDFLERIGLAVTLEAMEARCRSEDDLRQAQAYGQMYDLVIEALEQLYRVLGRTIRPPEDFAALLAAILSQYRVGTIPASLDSVTAGGPAAMRFVRCRAMFVLGADDGVFPASQPEQSLLTEQDRRRLQAVGLPVASGRSDQLDRELTALYQVLTAPAERLYIGCTAEPSYLFTRLRGLFPEAPLGTDAPLPEILLYDAAALGEAVAAGLLAAPAGAAGDGARAEAEALRAMGGARLGTMERDAVRGLYGRKLYLSASRIDLYASCRCAYFLRYGLRLRPRKEADFDAPAYGTFVHAILEQTARQVRQEGGFRRVDEARLLAIARSAMDGYRDETLNRMLERSERLTYLFRRNQAEVLAVVRELGREMRTSDFEPVGFEVEFSAAGAMPPVEIRGREAEAALSGFVDRVDLYTCGGTTYVRVVDYKTGQKAFDYTDVLNGIGLQMLIYLFALEAGGEALCGKKLTPAGVLYFPARQPILTASGRMTQEEAEAARQSELTRQGLLLQDETVLHAMEHYETKPVYLPFRTSRDGSLRGDLADTGQMRLLRAHVQRTLAQMADDIAGGAVEPNPIVRGADRTPCNWCDYAQICHRASGEVTVRPMQKTERGAFWERLEREEAEHG